MSVHDPEYIVAYIAGPRSPILGILDRGFQHCVAQTRPTPGRRATATTIHQVRVVRRRSHAEPNAYFEPAGACELAVILEVAVRLENVETIGGHPPVLQVTQSATLPIQQMITLRAIHMLKKVPALPSPQDVLTILDQKYALNSAGPTI